MGGGVDPYIGHGVYGVQLFNNTPSYLVAVGKKPNMAGIS